MKTLPKILFKRFEVVLSVVNLDVDQISKLNCFVFMNYNVTQLVKTLFLVSSISIFAFSKLMVYINNDSNQVSRFLEVIKNASLCATCIGKEKPNTTTGCS